MANANGTGTVTFDVIDSGSGTTPDVNTLSQSVSMTVTAVNDAPTQTTAGAITTVNEDSANSTAANLWSTTPVYGPGGGSDETGQTLNYKITAIPGFITLYKADGTTQVSPNDTVTAAEFAGLTYKTMANANGTGTVTFDVIDSGLSTGLNVNTLSSQSVTMTVTAVNDPANISGSTTALLTESNIAQTFNGTLSATDVDTLATFVVQTDVAGSSGYGKFSINSSGAWTYTMNTAQDVFVGGQFYTDSITVATADGTTQLITVTMAGTHDWLDANSATDTVAENSAAGVSVGVTAKSDSTGGVSTYSLVNSDGSAYTAGKFAINSSTGVVTTGTTALDYETSTSETIYVKATNGAYFSTKSYAIAVQDVFEPTVTVSNTFESLSSSGLIKNFGTTFSNATGSGDADNEWLIYPGGATQRGGYMVANVPPMTSMIRATAIEASFKLYFSTAEGDGVSYSFGRKNTLFGFNSTSLTTPENYENGFSTGLAVCFIHRSQPNTVLVRYNNQTLAVSNQWVSRDVPHVIQISVGTTGLVRVSVDGTDYIGGASGVTAQINDWTSVDQSGWEMGLGGRTGNNTGLAWVDDFTTSAATSTSVSPLVLDLNGDGVQTTGTANGVRFDLAATGQAAQVGWVAGGDGLLAIDRNHDGQINSGAELFGNAITLANGTKAADGWAALAEMDSNGDGVVDASDAGFADLRVWVDANHDGKTDAGELHTLAEVGVSQIALAHSTERTSQGENILDGLGSFVRTDGSNGQMTDVWFRMQEPEPVLLNQALHQVNGQAVVDLVDGHAQTLQIGLQDMLDLGQQSSLKVLGTGKDLVCLDEALAWVQSPTVVTQGDHTFHVYQSQTLGTQVLLGTELQVSLYKAAVSGLATLG